MRGLADLRSLFHLQMQFLMPGVKVTTFSEIHLKLAAELVILSLIWAPEPAWPGRMFRVLTVEDA